MKILFCSQCPVSQELGASKTLIELAEELENLGWFCKIIEPSDIAYQPSMRPQNRLKYYAENLRRYLHEHASEYDIIEYEHFRLPYCRQEFHPNTLFVARSQLLGHHWKNIEIPKSNHWKSRARSFILGTIERTQIERNIQSGEITCEQADLIIVFNYADEDELIKSGIRGEKIRVVPGGISRTRRRLFEAVSSDPPVESKIAFIGTFDNRKGAKDFPEIVKAICKKAPNASFRFLGTQFPQERVLPHFPKGLRNRIEVIPHFPTEDLPVLLSSCSVGIFPSYIEGFGYGVLEMLAASVPVIAYDSPGPPMMLPPEYLVPRGDTKGMSKKVISLLNNKAKLTAARIWAKQQSQQFCWQQIAKETSEIYLEHWQKRQIIAAIP